MARLKLATALKYTCSLTLIDTEVTDLDQTESLKRSRQQRQVNQSPEPLAIRTVYPGFHLSAEKIE